MWETPDPQSLDVLPIIPAAKSCKAPALGNQRPPIRPTASVVCTSHRSPMDTWDLWSNWGPYHVATNRLEVASLLAKTDML